MNTQQKTVESGKWTNLVNTTVLLLLLPGKGRNSINECLCPVIKNSSTDILIEITVLKLYVSDDSCPLRVTHL